MAINKKLIHFKTFANFNSYKLSANESNTKYTIGVNSTIYSGSPDILYDSICYIKDKKLLWTHGQLYCDSGEINEEIKEELNKIAERVDENEEIVSKAIFNLQDAVEANELITTKAISDVKENVNILDSAIVVLNDNLETQNRIITDIFESIENLDKVVSTSIEHINQVIKDNEESITASMIALNGKMPTKTSALTNDSGFITVNGVPNEVELVTIFGDMLVDKPIYTNAEVQAIIDAYNVNKLIAIKCGARVHLSRGWFIPNISIYTQSGISKIFLSGILGSYYIEHHIVFDTNTGTISTTAQPSINLSGISTEPMICAYIISSYTANRIELYNYTYKGQTMDYREGAIISIINASSIDVIFEGGTLILDGKEYRASAFTISSGATALFSLGPYPDDLLPISPAVGVTTSYVNEAIANAITNTLNTPV